MPWQRKFRNINRKLSTTRLIKEIQGPVEHLAPSSGSLRADNNGVTEICHRLAFVVTVTKIWDSTSKNEIIVWSTAKGLHRLRH